MRRAHTQHRNVYRAVPEIAANAQDELKPIA